MKRRLFAAVLPGTASADSGPKPAVTITVVNAPAGEYYLDLLITDPEPDHDNIEVADYDPELIAGLKSWEGEGWYPALVTGTRAPLFGELTAEADGIHRFSYHGLPDTFRIAVSGPDGAQATAEPFTRTVFYTHLRHLPGGVLRRPVFVHSGANPNHRGCSAVAVRLPGQAGLAGVSHRQPGHPGGAPPVD